VIVNTNDIAYRLSTFFGHLIKTAIEGSKQPDRSDDSESKIQKIGKPIYEGTQHKSMFKIKRLTVSVTGAAKWQGSLPLSRQT